jgi:nitrite reductase/ring-hydroxylating ferredoxin subunit
MGEEVVMFRTQSGEYALTDAHCPHMGSHLAHGGAIEGELIRCPFHGFCFDTQGNCTKTGYGTKVPPQIRLKIWPTREINGLLLVYYHPHGEAPAWHVPELDETQWSSLIHDEFQIRSHPQETTENSVDFGHFAIVHGYTDTETLNDLHIEGPYLNGKYALRRVADVFMASGSTIRAEFNVHVWGLGYSLVDVWVEKFDLHTRVFVFPAPIDGEQITMRSAVSINTTVSPKRIHWALGLLPRNWALRLIQKATLKGYCDDLSADFEIWENKMYMQPPALAKGDGPIAAYRKYCRQFYPHLDEWIAEQGDRQMATQAVKDSRIDAPIQRN